MRLDDQCLESLLKQGESYRVELKQALGDRGVRAIREVVCAFANDLPGTGMPGVLFLGVSDLGQPTGLEISDELLRMLSDVKTDGQIVPPPTLLVEKRTVMNCDVAVVTVMPSDSPPVRYQGKIHVRIGPRRGIATSQDERILNEKRQSSEKPYDLFPIRSADLAALNLTIFQNEYLPRAFDPTILEANDRSLNERLAVTKMIASADDTTPTVVGMLTFGRNPRDFLPGAWIQFLRINGDCLADEIVDEVTISGDISSVLKHTEEKLKAQLQTRIDAQSSFREIRHDSYPMEALRQIVRNAVMHRAYEGTHAPVRITWFNERVEILSPGGAYGIVTRETFGQPGLADYRNPNLTEAMRVLGFVQRFGVGIPIARRALKHNGNPDLRFDVNDNFVMATMEVRKR